MLSSEVLPPLSHALQEFPPSSDFLPPLTLPDLAATTAAVVFYPAVFAIAAAVTATSDAADLVPPKFRTFGHVDVVLRMITIFRIYF